MTAEPLLGWLKQVKGHEAASNGAPFPCDPKDAAKYLAEEIPYICSVKYLQSIR